MGERLPIEDCLPDLRSALAAKRNAVITAQPGAGKTTIVPMALMNEPWVQGRRIVMLEPRRIAARTAARRMAQLLGEEVGHRVGYRTKGDAVVGKHTRIEVVTEGILTRLLHADPGLESIAAVIFDEFHERSIHADLGLALCLQCQALFREDLRLIVMSATLEAESAAALLGGADVIRSIGRAFPVETFYAPSRSAEYIEKMTARAVLTALNRHKEGDLLVFLPGGAEIRRTMQELNSAGLPSGVRVAPLYGILAPQDQDAAIRPSRTGERKVVLATNIAETSLTVEGVSIVIDAGYSRVPKFSPRNGLTKLETVRVTASSADQRRGRAGRTGPGICYRLWTEEEQRQLKPYNDPEILTSDLSSLALDLAIWGVSDPAELEWLNPPPEGAYQQAKELLELLGALDADGNVTPHGRLIAAIGTHPRLASMIVRAKPLGLGRLACELSVLLEERAANTEIDMRLQVEMLRRRFGSGPDPLQREIERRMKDAGIPDGQRGDPNRAGELLAFAYPDRIAMRRPSGTFLLANGRGAELPAQEPLSREMFLAAAELDGAGNNSRIRSAAPLALNTVLHSLGDMIRESDEVEWDQAAKAVRARRKRMLGALILEEKPLSHPDPDRVLTALLHGLRLQGLQVLSWPKASVQWRQRMMFLRSQLGGEWPDVSDEALLETLEQWLAPHAYGIASLADLQRLNVKEVLEQSLTWEQKRRLDEWAPTHIQVPSGSRIAIDYSNPEQPVLAVRLQEIFGWEETPRIAGGLVPLTLHLLSPAQRPVQVTKDLANFWRETYYEIKKDLKGRYPKHYWPENPLDAAATRGTKPRTEGKVQ